jgi:hypothetical protein
MVTAHHLRGRPIALCWLPATIGGLLLGAVLLVATSTALAVASAGAPMFVAIPAGLLLGGLHFRLQRGLVSIAVAAPAAVGFRLAATVAAVVLVGLTASPTGFITVWPGDVASPASSAARFLVGLGAGCVALTLMLACLTVHAAFRHQDFIRNTATLGRQRSGYLVRPNPSLSGRTPPSSRLGPLAAALAWLGGMPDDLARHRAQWSRAFAPVGAAIIGCTALGGTAAFAAGASALRQPLPLCGLLAIAWGVICMTALRHAIVMRDLCDRRTSRSAALLWRTLLELLLATITASLLFAGLLIGPDAFAVTFQTDSGNTVLGFFAGFGMASPITAAGLLMWVFCVLVFKLPSIRLPGAASIRLTCDVYRDMIDRAAIQEGANRG